MHVGHGYTVLPHIPCNINQLDYETFGPSPSGIPSVQPDIILILYFLPVLGYVSLEHKSPTNVVLVMNGGLVYVGPLFF